MGELFGELTEGAPMQSSEGRQREPLISVAAVTFLGGAMLWAEKQDWVDLAIFLDDFLKSWRDILRAFWGALLAKLHIPFPVLPHQKDALSLISFLTIGSLYRVVFGRKPDSLFYPTFEMWGDWAGSRYGALGAMVVFLVSSTISITLCVALLAPFFDTVAFTHDFYVWWIVIYSVGIVYATLIFLYDSVVFAVEKIRTDGMMAYVAYVTAALGYFAMYVIVIGLVSIGVIFLLVYVSDLLPSLPIGIPLDPRPFSLDSYVNELDVEKYLDLGLIAAAFLLLALTAGRSLRPIAQFLLVGGAIVFLGWLAAVLMAAFPQQFSTLPS